MDTYKHIIKTWDSLAEVYEEKFMGLNDYNDSYDLFLTELGTQRVEILEIACGPGMITKYFLTKYPELKITASDASPSMLHLAKKNCPTAETLLLDCRDLIQLKKSYDGIVSGFVLPYLMKEDVIELIKEFSLHLNSGGLLYLSALEGDYATSRSVKSSDGKYEMMNYYYTEQELVKLLKENQFEIIHSMRITSATNPTSLPQLILIAKFK